MIVFNWSSDKNGAENILNLYCLESCEQRNQNRENGEILLFYQTAREWCLNHFSLTFVNHQKFHIVNINQRLSVILI